MSKIIKNVSGKKKKQIDVAVKKARPNGNGKVPVTAQQSIPFKQMFKDGICKVDDNLYTKTVQFFDINYQLAQNEDKTAIFENYCDFLNYFDSSINVQLSFLNQVADVEEFHSQLEIDGQDDEFNDIRQEYTEMLKNQLAKGNNGLVKTKYITFGVKEKSLKEAKPKLERIEADILGNFKIMGVLAQPMNGAERLAVLHRSFNPDGREKFRFSWDLLPKSGLSVKDFIAPSSFDFSKGNSFRMSGKYGAVSFINIMASEMSDRMLADFLNIEHNITLSIHIQSIDQNKAVKMVKSKITDLDKMKMEEQKKAFRNGYDIDIMPSDINTFGKEAKSLLNDLQSRNERLFMATILIMNTADTKRKLDNIIFQEQGIAQKYNCQLKRLDYQQEDGIMACVPIGVNDIEIKRGLTTSSTAIFVPFTTQELFQGGEALYYGLNALSNNMILCDRKQLKNPNGLILGTPGSGKSFSAKREITNAFLTTTDDIIICDPEAEYYPLVKGKENVYFMNLVDEYDMLAFAEDFPEGVTVETPDGEQVEPVTDADGNVIENSEDTSEGEKEDKTEKTENEGGGNNTLLILVGVLALAGGGAFYYFKVYKAKPKAPKQSLYDEDEEEYEEETVNEDIIDENTSDDDEE